MAADPHPPRRPAHPVDELFVARWSPRAFDGSPVPADDLATVLEAARWAPSAFNVQPWRFIYALRGDAEWPRLLELLIPFNAAWAGNAGALIFICSDRYIPARPDRPPELSHSHSFDAGAAWAMLALQAFKLGYHAHAMTGVEFERASVELAVPETFRLEAAVAVGIQAERSTLPEALQARESPSDRRPLDALVFHGRFGEPSGL